MDDEKDSDLELQEEVDEELQTKQDEFYSSLENQLKEMQVAILSEDQVKKIGKAIGQGAFGKVYKGEYQGKPVAIKKILLKSDNFDDDEQTKKALYDITNEIKTVKYVTNSKIPIFFGLWKHFGRFHLIFEFCPGKNLKDAYNNLNDKQKLLVILQISEILETIHERKLIHRDIKPSNIMIDENLDIKLIDFGVSRIAQRTSTFTTDASGTTRYMAPESFDIPIETESDKPIRISTKLDVFSTGCMISEIFSGILPWFNKVKNELVVRKKLMEGSPFPIPDEITNPDIREIIEKCVKNNPDERISSAELTALIKEKLKKFE